MKAVYLLVCLALARESVGSVFRRQQYPSSMMVQPLDEIDQYQLQQRLTTKQAQRNHQKSSKMQTQHSAEQSTKKHQSHGSSEEKYPTPYRQQVNQQSSEENQNRQPTKYQQTSEENQYMQPRKSQQSSEQNQWQQGKKQQSSEEIQYRQQAKYQKSSEENQYRKQSKYQQSSEETLDRQQTKYQQSSEEKQYRPQAKYQQSSEENMYSQKGQKRSYQSKQFKKPKNDQISSEERYQNLKKRQQSSEQSSEEQRYQPQQDMQYRQQYHDSTEVQQNKIMAYTSPLYADKVQKGYPLVQATRSNKKQMMPVFGDSIEWRGVKIAAGPSTSVNKQDIELIFNKAYETINHVSSEEMKTFHETLEAAIQTNDEDSQLNATELLKKNQYEVEEHTIKTEDGYYLTLFRITPKEQTLVQKPVVFLMHGLLGSADDWLLMGPGKSLAYLLADAGYEVWLGNSRGNKYSRRHVTKHPALADFWQFSNDEIALIDLPAMIDYALNVTKQEKLYYVGYSQGTTAFFALASTRPEYNDKIIMMYALSPMVYMSNVISPMLRMIAPTSPMYDQLRHQLGHGRFMPSKELVSTVGGAMCQNEIGCKNVCSNVNFVMSGVNVEGLDVKLIPNILSHLPAGGSTRQIKQYAQGVASQQFTKYDFGSYMNEKIYGSVQPPKYEMSKVKTPVALYYSSEDWLAAPRDVRRLEAELINVKDSYMIPLPHFSNMDFQFSKNAPEAVYNRLIESIKAQDKQKTY